MQTYIPQPPSLKGDERAQLEQMYRYLYKMSEQLNTALAVTDKEYQIVVQKRSGSAPGSDSPITPQLDAQYRELRSLIIKTADIVNQQMDKTIKQLNGKFEAISSEWGTFEQNIERKIVETAEATIDSFDYSEKIHGIEKTVLDGVTSYAIESLGYIKRGIIGFDDENFPIYGIAVGTELKEKTVEKDGKTYQQIDTTKRIATYTSDAITFWRNDVAIARFSGDELYVTRAEITQQIRLGDWFFSVAESGGLNISKRLGSAIDISENGTITSLVGDINEANTSISQTQNDITALAKRASTAEEKISSTESKLELKADSAALSVVQEDVDSLSGRVSTAESKLELKADSATLSVTEVNLKQYVTDKVDNISVGGRNLLLGTNQGVTNWDVPVLGTLSETVCLGANGMKLTVPADTNNGGMRYTGVKTSVLEADTDYVLSFDLLANKAFNINTIDLMLKDGTAMTSTKTITTVANTWTRYVLKLHTLADGFTDGDKELYFWITADGRTAGTELSIVNLKLEKGNKSTDWSPAPEDIEGDVSALEQRVSTAEQKITADAIVSTVTSSTSYKTLSSTASTAKSTAETAQSTANTAKTNASNAQSTADTAKSKADSNATDITGLKTRMTTAESKIDQKADSITLSVLETKVDGIAVGGTNLLPKSKYASSVTEITQNSRSGYGYAVSPTQSLYTIRSEQLALESDVEYTLSFTAWIDANGASVGQAISVDLYPDDLPQIDYPWTTDGITNKPKRFVWTFSSSSENMQSCRLRFFFDRAALGYYVYYNTYITDIKLEKGNKSTDWSPAPEDPAGSLSVSSDYSKVDINTERVRIVSKRMEVAVPSDDGEDDVLRVDADGVHAEVVEADQIVSESVVHTQGAASYTPANAGELAAILEELSGKHLMGYVTINCASITSGSYAIRNISGGGTIALTGGTMNQMTIEHCTTMIYMKGIAFSNSGTALTVSRSPNVYANICVFNAGVGVNLNAEWFAQMLMNSCSGDCTVLANVGMGSQLRCIGASKPTGTVSLTYGGEVYNATSDPTFAAKESPSIPTTQTVTVSLSPTQTYTLRGTSNSDGNKLYQGRYSSSQSLRKGVMLFTLPSDLTSANNIDSATLTLRRIAGAGQGGGVTVQVRCYDVTGTLYASKTAYEGQTVSIDVTSAVKAMKTNGYTGLMLYNPDTTTVGSKTYTASYSRFAGKGESGAPVLKVSYRK